MAVEMKPVFSSHVAAVGWDSETNEILVEWKSGKVSAYAGGTAEMADQLSRAPSVGNMLQTDIKPHLQHRYVK